MEPTLTRQTPAQHIVWLDVVRLVAMFTVVCCHCTDPFNFYPGTSPDIVDIKFWGAVYGAALRLWRFCSSLCSSLRDDHGSIAVAGTG